MKKLLVTLAVFCLLGSAASAQNILRNLGQRAKNAAWNL